MAIDHNGKLITNEEEDCEKIVEELWKSFYYSNDPAKRKAADALAPVLSLIAEFRKALFGDDRRKTYFIGKIIQKYKGPKDTVTDYQRAKQALREIRSYNEPPSPDIY